MANTIKHTLLLVSTAALISACSSGYQTQNKQYGYGPTKSQSHHVQNGYYNPSYAQNNHMYVQNGYNGYQGCQPQPVYTQPVHPCAYPQTQTQHYAYQTSHSQYNHGQAQYTGYGYGQGPAYWNGQPYAARASHPPVRGRGSKLSYESLNAFEAPVATELAGVTFELRGRLDSVTDYSLENNGDPNHRLVGRHRLTAVKQLPNRYTVGATFTGHAGDIGNGDSDYKGRIRGFVGGSWGTFFGGNVQDLVYEDTRRLRGAGRNVGRGPREENLWGDGAQGRLSDWGGGYQGRYGPMTISTVVDEDANYDVGVKFQRPIGNKDYRLTARHNTGSFLAEDGVTEVDTKAITGVGEYVYGSTRYDISGGVEQFETGGVTADRWFTSAGVTTKKGVWSLTAEALYGQVEGQDEASAFVGVKYDMARGLAATAAVDYRDRDVNINGTSVISEKDTRALLGLSYGF